MCRRWTFHRNNIIVRRVMGACQNWHERNLFIIIHAYECEWINKTASLSRLITTQATAFRITHRPLSVNGISFISYPVNDNYTYKCLSNRVTHFYPHTQSYCDSFPYYHFTMAFGVTYLLYARFCSKLNMFNGTRKKSTGFLMKSLKLKAKRNTVPTYYIQWVCTYFIIN